MKPYPKYKPSGIEWIGEIPEHWEMNRFGYLFSFSRGLPITKENLQDEGVPCVSYGEIHSRYGFEVNPEKHLLRCVSKDYLNSNPNALLKKGDFLFADTSEDIEGSGNFTYLNSNASVFAGYHTIIAKPVQKFYQRYIAYFFDSLGYRTQIRSVVNGTKVYSITQAILKRTNVILPLLEEQTAIADYLDKKTAQIDDFISKKQKLIQLLKEERTAVINEAVSGKGKNWERKKLKYVTEINSETLSEKENDDLNIKYIDISSVDENGNIISTMEYLYPEAPSRARRIVRNGDTILSTVRTYLKAIAFIQDASDNLICSTGFAVIRPTDKLNEQFLFYTCRSQAFIEEIMSLSKGVSYPSVDSENVKNIEISIPSISVQIKIVENIQTEIQKIDNTISKIEKEIELMQEYRTALISEVVTGKIKIA